MDQNKLISEIIDLRNLMAYSRSTINILQSHKKFWNFIPGSEVKLHF